MDEPSFLDELHAQFSTPLGRVGDLVTRHTGRRVVQVQRVINGYDNEVYRVRLLDHSGVYARIRRHGEGDFAGEIAAMEWALEAAVPVPRVIGLDHVITDDGERDVMIVAAAPGQAFETVGAGFSVHARHDALVDLGRVLGRLHRVRMPGMWRPDGAGRWPSLAEQRAYFVRDRLSEGDDLRRAGLSTAEIDHVFRVLEAPADPTPSEPVLCHGDLKPGHVFIDADAKVCCLIDWGMWHAGPAIGDLAYLRKTFADGLGAVLEGHGGWSLADPAFRRLLARALAEQQIGYIAHHVHIGDARGVEQNVGFLRTALAKLT